MQNAVLSVLLNALTQLQCVDLVQLYRQSTNKHLRKLCPSTENFACVNIGITIELMHYIAKNMWTHSQSSRFAVITISTLLELLELSARFGSVAVEICVL